MAKGPCVAQEYHRLTKYSEEGLRAMPGIDWSLQPAPYKEIVSKSRVALRPHAGAPLGKAHPLGALGDLLFHANGVTGMIRAPGGEGHFLRAAPSAGALYPTEVYVAAGAVEGLEPGLYNYQVRDHELVRLWDGDHRAAIWRACGDAAALDGAEACVLLTGVFWRSAWRYQERGYRRVLLDTGHVLANVLAHAPHAGFATVPVQGFVDDAINGLFFFDGVTESVLVCLPLRGGAVVPVLPPLWSSAPAAAREMEAVPLRGEGDLEGSAMLALHRASACAAPRPAVAKGGPRAVSDRSIRLLAPPPDLAARMPHAIARRRSARAYGGAPVPLAKLGHALGFAFARLATRDAGLLRAHLVATRVDGLDAGVYEVEGAGEALLPLALGDCAARLREVTLGQDIAERCAAVLFLSAPAGAACALWGDRAYRYLHVEAGVLGERLQLAATALDLAACGIAGFFDDPAASLAGIPTDDFLLYLITLGSGP